MPSLREMQLDFVEAIFKGGSHLDGLLAHCMGPISLAEQGLAAYRRSVLGNLSVAVQTTYPVLQSIVGHDFLVAAAHAYAQQRPSQSGNLNDYGSDFDAFIADFEPAKTLPYLPDVAKLEWLVQKVCGAEKSTDQDLALLISTPPENWGSISFKMDPAHALLQSKWPVARIWEVNQTGYAGDLGVDFSVAQTVLVHRRPVGVAVDMLSPGEMEFLLAISEGNTLDRAVDTASRFKSFDLEVSMQHFIANGLFRQAD